MAITYPLELAAFYDAIGGWSNRFELMTYQTLTGLADGSVIAVQHGTPKWGGDFTITPRLNRANVGVEAMINSLKGSVGSFKAYDMRRAYPLNDPDGSFLANGSLLALGDVSASGVVSSATYTYEGSAATIGQATTLTRSSTATYIDVNGVMQTAAIDTLRFDYSTGAKMMLVEAAGTNSIRNNTMVGAVAGAPGTLPTNWAVTTLPSGISREIVGTGTENGITYIDIRFYGTAGASGSWAVNFEANTGIATVQGETWTNSAYLKMVSGTVPGNFTISQAENSSVPAFLAFSQSIIAVNSTLTRYSHTRTMTDAAVAYVKPGIAGVITNGQVFDFTIRIGLPQMEKAAAASSAIATSGSAVTRSADVLTFRGKGTNDWTLTFDNNTTQAYANEVDDLAITASALTRPNIKSWSAIRDTHPAAAAVKIKSVGSNNKSLALKGLPPFYQLAVGDYISFVYSTTLVALHQVLEAATADYLGDTAEFEVTPFIRTGAAADDVVTLVKPYCLSRIVPGSYRAPASAGPQSGGGSFKFIQVLK